MIRTLVVEDDPVTADAQAEYLRRLGNFRVVGIAQSAKGAVELIEAALETNPIELILLDMNLPDGHGLDLARRLHAAGITIDIIAITAVREIEVVHQAISVGVVQYLIKPFTFATFSEKLGNYLQFKSRLDGAASSTSQGEIDTMLASLRTPVRVALPKGLSGTTLDAVCAHLRSAAPRALSAVELAGPLHLSRVTARRYLEHLSENGRVARAPRYGTPGRPELEYRWLT